MELWLWWTLCVTDNSESTTVILLYCNLWSVTRSVIETIAAVVAVRFISRRLSGGRLRNEDVSGKSRRSREPHQTEEQYSGGDPWAGVCHEDDGGSATTRHTSQRHRWVQFGKHGRFPPQCNTFHVAPYPLDSPPVTGNSMQPHYFYGIFFLI